MRSQIFAALATLTDGLLRVLAVITLDDANKLLASAIALLSVIHLVIKIRKEAQAPGRRPQPRKRRGRGVR